MLEWRGGTTEAADLYTDDTEPLKPLSELFGLIIKCLGSFQRVHRKKLGYLIDSNGEEK